MNQTTRISQVAQVAQVAEPDTAAPHCAVPHSKPVPLGMTLLPDKTAVLDAAGFAPLAQALGLPADPELVRIDLMSSDAKGRMRNGRVELSPGTMRGPILSARALLAHELTHLAQTRAPGRVLTRARLALAETEALNTAQRAADGLVVHRPRARIAPDQVLHDTSLSNLVETEFAPQIARIKNLLRGWLGFLWVTDGAVRDMFILVEGEPLAVQQAIFAALDPHERETLLDNVSPEHFSRFRSEILAAFSVTEPALIAQQGAGLFEGMEFSGLTPQEVASFGAILDAGFPETAQTALRNDPQQGTYVAELFDTDLRQRARAVYDPATADADALQALQSRIQTRAAAIQAARDDPSGQASITRLKSLLNAPSDTERLNVLDTLGGLMGRPQIFEGVVQSLQPPAHTTDLLDVLLDDMPVRQLRETGQQADASGPRFTRMEALLRLASLRPAYKNMFLAEDLLSEAWIFNTISSEEAFLAYQLLKSLPDALRANFLEDDGGEFAGRIADAMSQEMREETGMNFYRGGDGRTDLASIQAQLLEDALWTLPNAGRLRGLIRMAAAAGEAEWVFLRSHEAHDLDPTAYNDPEFSEQIVAPFMLFGSELPDGGLRRRWQPEYSEWQYNGFVSGFIGAFEMFGDLISLLHHSRDGAGLVGNVMFGRSVGGQGIDGVSLQNLMGGSILGFRLAESDDASLGQERRDTLSSARETQRGTNYIDRAYWDQNNGVLELSASNLDLAAIRYPLGDILFSAEGGQISGLNLSLNIGTREATRPTNMILQIERLDLTDTLLVQRGSMTAINGIHLSGLDVRLGRNALTGDMAEAETGFDPIALFPLTPLLKATGFVMGLDDRVSEITTGLTEPPNPSPLVVSFDELTLTGITTSSGQYVQSTTIENARIGVAGTVDDYLAILWESVQANVSQKVRLIRAVQDMPTGDQRTALEQRVEELAVRVRALNTLSQQILAAQATVTRLTSDEMPALSEADQHSLTEAQGVLAPYQRGGITLDVGGLTVRGLLGNIDASIPRLTDLHGHGAGSAGLLAFLTDSEALGRIIEGPAHRNATVSDLARETSEFRLELPDFTLEEVTIRASIPTLAETQGAVDRADDALAARTWDPRLIAARAAALLRHTNTERYLKLAAAGVTHLTGEDGRELRDLRTALLAAEAVYIHHLEVEDATAGFSAESGSLILAAEAFRATGDDSLTGPQGAAIRAGDLSIGAAEGRNIELSIGVNGGLQDFSNLSDRLARVGLTGTSFNATDIAHQGMDITLDRIGAEGFNIALDTRAGVLEAQADTLGIDGLHGRASRAWVETQIAALSAKPLNLRTSADEDALRHFNEALDTIAGFETLLEQLDTEIIAAAPEDRERLIGERADAIHLYLLWEQRFAARSGTVDGLGVRVSGLGPLGEGGFDTDAALDRGITIEGTGGQDGRRIFSRLAVTDGRFGAVEAGRLDVGETSGAVTISNTLIAIQGIRIQSLTVAQFLMTSSSDAPATEHGGTVINQIFSHGTTTAEGIDIDANLHFEQMADDPTQYRMARVELTTFHIDRLEAGHLGFASTHNAPDPLAPDPHGRYQSSVYELDGGAIRGLDASNMTIRLPAGDYAATIIEGTLELPQIDGVRGTMMIEDALDYGSAQMTGEHISIRFTEQGERIVELGRAVEPADGTSRREGGLRLTDGEARLPDGSTYFSTGMITGRINNQGDRTRLEGVGIEHIRLERFNFRAGARQIYATRPLVLRGIEIDASLDTAQEGNTRVRIDALSVDAITSEELTVLDNGREITIRQDPQILAESVAAGTPAQPPLQVIDLEVHNLAWSTRGGVASAGRSGAGTIDIGQIHTAFNLFKDDIDLDVIMDAADIDFDFLRDGTQRLDVDDLDARVVGDIDADTAVKMTMRDASVSGAIISDTLITLPNLSIPTITLDRLSIDSPSMRLNLPETGGRVVLTGTEANIEISRDPDNAEHPISEIAIRALRVPTITARGLTLTLIDAIGDPETGGTARDLTVRIREADTATISGLRLDPREGDPAFTIAPDPAHPDAWAKTGLMHVDSAEVDRIGVEIENMLTATADVDAAGLDLDFLASQGTAVSLESLFLGSITGTAGARNEHVFNLTEAVAAGFGAPNAGVALTGLSRDHDGNITLDSGVLSGLTYTMPDKGVTMTIQSASLPGQRTGHTVSYAAEDGNLVIPELVITEASIDIDDVMALSAEGSDAASGPEQNLDFLNALNGFVSFDLGNSYITEKIGIEVVNGAVNFDQIEDTISIDALIDFDVEGTNLVINLDYGNALGLLPAMIPWLNYELYRSENLTPEEQRRAEDDEEATLATLIRRVPESEDSGGGSDDPPPISLFNIDGAFTLNEVPVDLGENGQITVNGGAPGVAVDLALSGDLQNDRSATNSQITFDIGDIGIAVDASNPLTLGGVTAESGRLEISDFRDVQLQFEAFTPKHLAGAIGGARLTNLRISGL